MAPHIVAPAYLLFFGFGSDWGRETSRAATTAREAKTTRVGAVYCRNTRMFPQRYSPGQRLLLTAGRFSRVFMLHAGDFEMAKALRPGTPAPVSGQYRNPSTGTEVTGVARKPLPPTPRPGQGYVLVDRTKHRSK